MIYTVYDKMRKEINELETSYERLLDEKCELEEQLIGTRKALGCFELTIEQQNSDIKDLRRKYEACEGELEKYKDWLGDITTEDDLWRKLQSAMNPEIDRLAMECYEGAKVNGFYGPDVLVPEDILEHLKEEIQEVEEAETLLDAMPEVVDCIMVLLGLHERLLQMRFLVSEEIPEEELSLGKAVRAKLAYNRRQS